MDANEEIGNIIKTTLDACSTDWGEIANFFIYTHQGMGFVLADNSLKYGFGVLSDLTPSLELLSEIEKFNTTMSNWYCWLSQGSDNNHWSLIAGSKVMYGLLSRDKLIDLVKAVVEAQQLVTEKILSDLSDSGGSIFWQPQESGIDGSALLLMIKLG